MGASRSKNSGQRSKKSGNPTAFSRLKEQMQAVDLLFEIRDARLPLSSKHPKGEEIFGNKPRVIVLSKQDLAEPDELKIWTENLVQESQYSSLALSFKYHKGQDKLVNLAMRMTEEKREALTRRGLLPRPMRVCVVGLPNVGKSTLINWLIGARKAKTGDLPGITRGNQWVRVHPQLELLDTPGLLPPVAFSQEVELKLSLCHILPDDRLDPEDVAAFGLALIARLDKRRLAIYGQTFCDGEPTLERMAVTRSLLASGGRPDTRRAATRFLQDFRAGKLGRLILDRLPSERSSEVIT